MKKTWDRFWFQAEGQTQVSLFRKVFSWILFGSYFSRSFDLEFFYSDFGLLKSSVIPDIISSDYRLSLLNYFHGIRSLWLFHGLFLASLIFLFVGRFTCVASLIALVLHLSFVHRNMGTVYGVDTIATYYLFYLCLFEMGQSKVCRKSPLSSIAFRFMQIQLCVIYAYSGFEKLRGPLWWNGDALWYALMNSQVSRWDLSWISHLPGTPIAIALASYSVILWEVYFPVVVWSKRWKLWALGVGMAFHLLIGVFFRIPFFAAAMISVYVLFLDSKELIQLTRFFRKVSSGLKLL